MGSRRRLSHGDISVGDAHSYRKSTRFPPPYLNIVSRRSRTSGISGKSKVGTMPDKSTSSSEEHPVPASQGPGAGRDSRTNAGNSRWPLLDWLTRQASAGWFGRTSPTCYRVGAERISRPCSASSPDGASPCRAGDGAGADSSPALPDTSAWAGECWTLDMCEWNNFRGGSRSDGGACCLSDIVETRGVSPKYSLAANCAAGILRRFGKMGLEVPAPLLASLRRCACPSTS